MRFRKPKFYYCDFWRMNFWFCLGWPPKMIEEYMKDRFDWTTDVTGANGKLYECHENGKVVMVIWVRNSGDIGSLAHECVHAADFTLNLRGVKDDFDNDEPLAYLVGNLIDAALSKKRG